MLIQWISNFCRSFYAIYISICYLLMLIVYITLLIVLSLFLWDVALPSGLCLEFYWTSLGTISDKGLITLPCPQWEPGSRSTYGKLTKVAVIISIIFSFDCLSTCVCTLLFYLLCVCISSIMWIYLCCCCSFAVIIHLE